MRRRATLQRISTDDPATKERTDYLAIFVADDGDRESEAQIIKLAENFINTYPSSRFEPQVRMKWGEILYRRGDYLGARAQFDCPRRKIPGFSTRREGDLPFCAGDGPLTQSLRNGGGH